MTRKGGFRLSFKLIHRVVIMGHAWDVGWEKRGVTEEGDALGKGSESIARMTAAKEGRHVV